MLPVNIYLMLQLNEIERREHIRMYNMDRRIMRSESDPFALRDEQFISVFRLNKEMVHYVLNEIQPHLNLTPSVVAVPNMLKLLTALNFFATGSYQRSLGQNFNFSVSQPKVSNIVNEISLAIGHMAMQWIRFPQTIRKKNKIKRRFMERTHFPGCIGAIDCTHVAIIAPHNEEHNYLNRKGFHSKNVQIICDYDMRILNVNANYPGAAHDSYIWRNSAIRDELERNYNLGDHNSWLVGDSGYPEECWLMTPIVNAIAGTPEFAYTETQMSARNCVERCIGVLKGRFRCIMGERKLRYEPGKVGRIVNACAILHNICTEGRLELEPLNNPPIGDEGYVIVNHLPNIDGFQARREIIERYFQ